MSERRPTLCLVVDRASLAARPREVIAGCVRGGVDRIQLRDRSLEGRDWLAFAESVIEGVRAEPGPGPSRPIEIIVNRRVDVALTSGADGVQLGFDALAITEARALLGPRAHIGVSTHGVDEALDATRAGADDVHLAPIYTPLSKPSTRPPLGPSAVSEAARGGARVIAQGGITAANAADVVGAGAVGVAVTGAIVSAPDPFEAAQNLRRALDRGASRAR